MDNDTGGQTCNLVESGTTPLHWAAKCGHCEICRLIMDNVTNKNPPDLDGWTPLHLAGKLRYKKFIFECKFSFDLSEFEEPFNIAARCKCTEVCKMIIESVEDAHPKNSQGETPLQLARRYGHADIVQLFEVVG